MTRHPMTAAVARLHELMLGEFGSSVRVDLGPQQGDSSSLDFVAVGLSTEDTSGMTGTVEYPTPRGQSTEHLEIQCMAQSVSGDADALARADRCYELVDVVSRLIEDDDPNPSDGSVPPVAWGRVVRHQTQWVETEAGFGALVLFTVSADAYRAGRRGSRSRSGVEQ